MIPTWKIFPSIPNPFNNGFIGDLYLLSLMASALMFAYGKMRRINAFYLWYGWAYLLNRNLLISNPGSPYVGWLLIACALVPNGEGTVSDMIKKKHFSNKDWYMPAIIYWGAWFLMAYGYTISGINKLWCPSWIDGSAITHVLNGLLARDNFIVNSILTSPEIIQKIHTWVSLLAEILFLPLGVFYYVRKWYWMMWIMIHLGILATINFTDLTLGVLMIHFFTFDNRWLEEYPFRLFFSNRKKD
jgi:hypothetical protein